MRINNLTFEQHVKRIANELIRKKGYVCAVDLLLESVFLSKKDYENWRFGKVDYLEKVCNVNLKKLSLISKIIREQSLKMKLSQSLTVYNTWGKRGKRKLRFSKSGDRNIEKAYATHHLNKDIIEKMKEKKARESAR